MSHTAGSDSPAFASCLRAFEQEFDYVFRSLRRHGIAPADAEDLAQDVFLVMWRRWSAYDSRRPLRPWLAGIAFRLANHHRGRRREDLRADFDLPGDLPDPEEQLELCRLRAQALAALASLPERHRAALVLCDLDGLSMPEIARLLEVPLSTAYTRVRRARLAFAAEVDRRRGVKRALPAAVALLGIERPPPPAPPAVRRRVLARVRARPADAPAPRLPRLRPAALELGIVAAAAALVLPTFLSPAAPVHALPVASTGGGGATAPAHGRRPAPRPRPPMLASAAGLAPRAPLPSLAEGMSGYWRFDDGRSATSARDLSGKGNDCRLRSLDASQAWTTGVHGGAIDLGRRGWLDCPQRRLPPGAPGGVTIAAWVNRARVSRWHSAVVTRELSGGDREDWFFGFQGPQLIASGSFWKGAPSARYTAPLQRWNHVAVTQQPDGSTVLYLDGREIAREVVVPRSPPRGGRHLMVGAGHSSGQTTLGQHFDGAVDELIVYERALAPAEVQALAAGAQPPLSL